MTTYAHLKELDVARITDAATKWAETAQALEELDTVMTERVVTPLTQDGWSGTAHGYAHEMISRQNEQLTAAATEARAIGDSLEHLAGRLGACQSRLREIEEEISAADYIQLHSDGSISWEVDDTVRRNDPDLYQSTITETQRRAEEFHERLTALLSEAADYDEEVASALRAHVEERTLDFNGQAVGDMIALQEAEMVAAWIQQGYDISPEAFTAMNEWLARNGRDPVFATALMNELGPDGLMEYYTQMSLGATLQDGDETYLRNMANLQENLGVALAVATHGDSGPRVADAWVNQLMEAGDDRFPGGRNSPLGFQVLANLMRTGEYDPAFVQTVGNRMVEFENGDPGVWEDGRANWSGHDDYIQMNFIGEESSAGRNTADWGYDPMTGLMHALAHSPEASTGFFTDTEPTDNLAYFLQQRQWPSDGAPDAPVPVDGTAGQDAFAHALRVGATGYEVPSTDPDAPPPMRTPEMAALFERTIGLTSDPASVNVTANMMDSFGELGAAYVDDLNFAINGEQTMEGSYYGSEASRQSAHATPGQDAALNFISMLGTHPDSHATMNMAQQMYTSSLVQQMVPGFDASTPLDQAPLVSAVTTNGTVQGLLAASMAEQAGSDAAAAAEEANQSLAQRTSWVSAGASVAVGIGAAAVPGGPLVTGIVVPVAAGATNQVVSDLVGRITEAHVRNPLQESEAASRAAYENSFWDPMTPVEHALDTSLRDGNLAPGETADNLRITLSDAARSGYVIGTESHENEAAWPPV
ncbi:DUF6571 family protein [Allostreptomyces psammosilenae]|uniref:DUF6571 domain-containing protein n=1 Tax=Allostreptomyces psammosilenae TaxID=1892865 RepID=A0A853A7P3_9ACTN|nr:DUF6571 family protein [Allostreptomyces psammosilenae]NYI06558.1 hypothetical protein [Allostreptomyces psammosilenae]